MPDLKGEKAIYIWMGEESQQRVLNTMKSAMIEDVSSAVEMLIERGALPIELEADIKDYMSLNHVESFSVAMQDLIKKGLHSVCKEGRGFHGDIDIQQTRMEFVE